MVIQHLRVELKSDLRSIVRVGLMLIVLLLLTVTNGAGSMSAGIVGSWGTGSYFGVAVEGNIACCAAVTAGVDIIDISSPANPVQLSKIDLSGYCKKVCLRGDWLYVAASWEAEIIDISNPRSPVLVSRINGNVADLEVHDNLAYLAAYNDGLKIFDVSRPWAPVEIGACSIPGKASRVEPQGDFAYVTTFDGKMRIVDIRNPRHPVVTGSYEPAAGIKVLEVAVAEGIAILACGRVVQFVDISHPAAPVLLSEFQDATGGYYWSVQARNRIAYLGCDGNGLRLLDFSHPAAPVKLGDSGQLPAAPFPVRKREVYRDVAIAGNLACMACGPGGLRLVDVSNPASPTHLGVCNYRKAGWAEGLYQRGKTVYLARSFYGGLEIIDLNDPRNPAPRGWFEGGFRCVRGAGDYVYAGRYKSFDLLDVSNPAAPVRKGRCNLQGVPVALETAGQQAFVVSYDPQNLEIIDLSDPANPQVAASCGLPDRPRNLCVHGQRAYIACGDSGLQIVNLEPATPAIIGTFDTPGYLYDVEIEGNLAYLADGRSELLIVDISDPARPVQVGTSYKSLAYSVRGVQLAEGRLYLSGYISGNQGIIEALDVSAPLNPVYLRSWQLPSRPGEFKVDGDSIHVADGDSSLLEICSEIDNDLYFPHAACSDGWQTDIAIINCAAAFSQGRLQAYDKDGHRLGHSWQVTLAPWMRREYNLGRMFPSESARIAYTVYETGDSRVVGYLKFSHPGTGYRVALPATRGGFENTLYVSHVASSQDWWTGISLVSTREDSTSPVITFSDGRQKNLTLAPGEHQAFSLRDLFGENQPGISSATISNCRGVVGLELFGGTHSSQLSGIALSGKLKDVLYYPHVTFDSAWWTGLVAYDPAAAGGSLEITPYDQAGHQLARHQIDFAAGQKKFVDDVAHMGLDPETAWLQIQASPKRPITGFELFGSGGALGGYTGVGIDSRRGVLPKISKSGWTGIALVNPNKNVTAEVVLEARNNKGVVVASRRLTLASHVRLLGTPADLFPGVDLEDATYIDYRSDRKLVAFQLNGEGVMLDALPALGCR